jgi:ketosteroid isomerase-like protein
MEEIQEANRRFYQALSELDLKAMEDVWHHESQVSCVHPGWPPLSGWERVREGWARIFDNTVSQRVEPRNVEVRVFGELGWVSCLEQITASSRTGGTISLAASNNLFLKTKEGWKMILHHASSIPVEVETPPATQVH